MPNFKTRIISIQQPNPVIDIENTFSIYKNAEPEHEPIKLSNGMYLHTYKVTEFNYEYDYEPTTETDF